MFLKEVVYMNIFDLLAQERYLPLPSPMVITVLALSLILGVDIALFTALSIIPSCTVIAIVVYAITEDPMATASASAMIAFIWFIAFLLRYFRGEKLPSLIPLPEYAKLLIMFIVILLSALADVTDIYFYTIYYLVMAIVGPVKSLLGTIGIFISTPLLLMMYTMITNYIMRYVNRVKGNVFRVSAIAGVLVLGLSVLTIGVADELIRSIEQLAPMVFEYVVYIPFIFALMGIFSISELREAFIKLEPEALTQLPIILMLLDKMGDLFPEIYIAVSLIILLLLAGVNIASIIGFGLGNRRSMISLTCLNNAFLSIALQAYYIFYI